MTQENPNQPVEQDISAEESQQEAIDSSAQELNTPEQEITQLQEKLTEAQDSFLRAKAEGENIRRRAAEDVTKEIGRAHV